MNSPIVRAAAVAMFISMSAAVQAQTTDVKLQEETKGNVEALKLELFQGARITEVPKLEFPEGMERTSSEGWVNISMMIDTQGKPYETMITDSAGDKVFEKDALKQIKRFKFAPATQDGKPVDSSFEFKVRYALTGPGDGARLEFANAYRQLIKTIETKNKDKADAIMAKLKADNLYEDVYVGFAQYHYARTWGTEAEQLEGLKRAIAHESKDSYLPREPFIAALTAAFPLQAKTKDFMSALYTWRTLERMKADEKILAAYRPTVEKIEALRKDERSFAVDGTLKDGSWHFHLLKRKFAVEVASGRVSEVKLRCYNKFVFFPFDPKLTYTVSDKYGNCTLQLLGDPESKFTLVQL